MTLEEEHNGSAPEHPEADMDAQDDVSSDSGGQLDQALLDALLAVEAGQPSSLLDTSSLGGTEGIFDDTLLAPNDPESLIVPHGEEILPPPPEGSAAQGMDAVAQLEETLETVHAEESPASSMLEDWLTEDSLEALAQELTSPATFGEEGAAEDRTPDTPSLEAEKTEEAALSQEELDRLIAMAPVPERPRLEIPVPSTMGQIPPEGETLRQDELDQLLEQASAAEAAPADAPVSEVHSQAELDRHTRENLVEMRPMEGTSSTAAGDEESLSQEELDRLIRGSSFSEDGVGPDSGFEPSPVQEVPPAVAAESEASLSQEELDRLIRGSSFGEDGAGPGSMEARDQQDAPPDFDQPVLRGAGSQEQGGEAEEALDQAALDALLAGIAGGAQETAVSGPSSTAEVFLDQSMLDQLLNDLAVPAEETKHKAPAVSSKAIEKPSEMVSVSGDLSQDMIDALVAAAQTGESSAPIVTENIAAAQVQKEPDAGLLSQADLDRLMEQARQQDVERQRAKQRALEAALSGAKGGLSVPLPPEPVETPAVKSARTRRSWTIPPVIRQQFPRVAASVAAGLLTTLTIFTALYVHQVHVPAIHTDISKPLDLLMAMKKARAMMQSGNYAGAAALLEASLVQTPPSPERSDGLYLQLEALTGSFVYYPDSPEYSALHAKIDAALSEAPAHPRAPEAMRWKAKLYEMDNVPYAAQEIYENILRNYANAPNMDAVLVDAARLAEALGDAPLAAQHVQRMLQQYPGSAYGNAARLILGDAYAAAGMMDDARTIYVRVAQAAPDSAAGADAFLRLARLAYSQGRYEEVLPQLETRLAAANSLEGNDEAYLLLGRTYRRLGRLEDARNALNDLVNFFPETDITAEALVELSQVFEELGQRDKALQIAQHAAARFPRNAGALRNKGEFLGLEGNPFAAAVALTEADAAGANDPALLLTAARYYRTAGLLDEANRTYQLLGREYGSSLQALTGGVEQANLLHQMGKYTEAVNQLEELARITQNTPHQLPVLTALSRIYRGLGLDNRVTEISRQIAQLASEPADLADAVLDLLDAGALEEALRISERIELAQLSNAAAYQLLTRLGEGLLDIDPRNGLAKMEEAYLSYPEERAPKHDQRLLEAYIAADRSDAARRLVMELAAAAAERPVLAPYLIDASIAWGDYLYGRGDYRAAADAYALTTDTPNAKGNKSDVRWAKYQQANALLALSDFQGSLNLFQEIAVSDAPWAKEAEVKAEYARLEQQMRTQPASTREG